MNNKKTKVFIIIGFVLVLIIIIITCILLQHLKNGNTEKIFNNDSNIKQTKLEETDVISVENIEDYYNIESFCNFILSNSYMEQKIYDVRKEEGEDAKINKTYIASIEELNLDIHTEYGFFLNKAYKAMLNEKNTVFFVEGSIYIKTQDTSKNNIKLAIIKDNTNQKCKVEAYGKNYKNIFNYSDNIEDTTIIQTNAKNFNETIGYDYFASDLLDKESTDEDIVKWLYDKYKTNSLYFPEDMYGMLDEEYKQQRFENDINNYKEYAKEFTPIIENNELSQYAKNEMDGYILYTLVDNRKYSYFVKVHKDYTDLKYLLDTYTITYDGYNEKYQNMSNSQKAAANMQKFVNMINTKDYSHAYEVLDNTFKNNNFSTLNEFKDYIKRYLYEKNEITDSEVSISDNYYTGKLYIMNGDDSYSASKVLNIVMVLKDGTDFVMSFNIE